MKKTILGKCHWFLMFTLVLSVQGCAKKKDDSFIKVKPYVGRVIRQMNCSDNIAVDVLNAPIGGGYSFTWRRDSVVTYPNAVELNNVPRGFIVRPNDLVLFEVYTNPNDVQENCPQERACVLSPVPPSKSYCLIYITNQSLKGE